MAFAAFGSFAFVVPLVLSGGAGVSGIGFTGGRNFDAALSPDFFCDLLAFFAFGSVALFASWVARSVGRCKERSSAVYNFVVSGDPFVRCLFG